MEVPASPSRPATPPHPLAAGVCSSSGCGPSSGTPAGSPGIRAPCRTGPQCGCPGLVCPGAGGGRAGAPGGTPRAARAARGPAWAVLPPAVPCPSGPPSPKARPWRSARCALARPPGLGSRPGSSPATPRPSDTAIWAQAPPGRSLRGPVQWSGRGSQETNHPVGSQPHAHTRLQRATWAKLMMESAAHTLSVSRRHTRLSLRWRDIV